MCIALYVVSELICFAYEFSRSEGMLSFFCYDLKPSILFLLLFFYLLYGINLYHSHKREGICIICMRKKERGPKRGVSSKTDLCYCRDQSGVYNIENRVLVVLSPRILFKNYRMDMRKDHNATHFEARGEDSTLY